jgi:hypothetical protein
MNCTHRKTSGSGSSIEPLEMRQLLSAAAVGPAGALRVSGDPDIGTQIVVGLSADRKSILVTFDAGSAQSFPASSVKKLQIDGGAGDDVIRIDESFAPFGRDVLIDARAGNDSIVSGGERDAIFAGAGDDTILDSGGANRIFGGAGNDSITCNGKGRDILFGGEGNDVILAGPGRDIVFDLSGQDMVFGGDQRDTLLVGPDATAFGEGGEDSLITVRGGNAQLNGGGDKGDAEKRTSLKLIEQSMQGFIHRMNLPPELRAEI